MPVEGPALIVGKLLWAGEAGLVCAVDNQQQNTASRQLLGFRKKESLILIVPSPQLLRSQPLPARCPSVQRKTPATLATSAARIAAEPSVALYSRCFQ